MWTKLILSLVFAVFVLAPCAEAFVCAGDDLAPSTASAASSLSQNQSAVSDAAAPDADHQAKTTSGCPHGGCCHQNAATQSGCEAAFEIASWSDVVRAPSIQTSLRSISPDNLKRPPKA